MGACNNDGKLRCSPLCPGANMCNLFTCIVVVLHLCQSAGGGSQAAPLDSPASAGWFAPDETRLLIISRICASLSTRLNSC